MTPRSPSGIRRVTLRRGTKYSFLMEGPSHERHVLERDTEVEVKFLAFEPGETHEFVLGGWTILVAYTDDVRDAERGT
jgi:hypothetical protein